MPDTPYIGITIGPIYDTMTAVTKPAALWAASYLFSYISRRLCENIHEAGVSEEAFVTPFFPKRDDKLYPGLFERTDGVGLFHDHIIFRESGDIYTKLPEIRNKVIGEAAEKFGIGEAYLQQYVMIAWARVNVSADTNAILAFSKVLDCLELPKTFVPKSAGDELKNALRNAAVKEMSENMLGIDPSLWQLVKQVSIWNKEKQQSENQFIICDIPHIASVCGTPDLKKNQYYAILRADGDNMSKILKTLVKDEDLQKFSATCFRYCSEAAKLVGDFGGVTIFAGGDDLFALVPCEGSIEGAQNNRGTVFRLMQEIRKTFETEFAPYIQDENVNPKPSLSFGLFLSYEKYPLYEAVERSGDLLFGTAKQTDDKNCTVVELQKHSGQSVELLIPNGSMEQFIERLDEVIASDDSDACLLSAGHKIALFRTLIDLAEDAQIPDLFQNLFDSDFHLGNSSGFLHDTLPGFFTDHCRKGMIAYSGDSEMTFTDENDVTQNSAAMALAGALRIFKFFVEKEEKKDTAAKKGARDDE